MGKATIAIEVVSGVYMFEIGKGSRISRSGKLIVE